MRKVTLLLCVEVGLMLSLALQAQNTITGKVALAGEECRHWVDSVMGRMSLEERVGQLFIYTIAPQTDKANRDLLKKVVKDYKIGGLLFSGGVMQEQAILTNEAQQMADVPLLVTFDGEWGLSMRLRNTPLFPRNMVLGCIQNNELLYEYGREVARECREMGVQVNFAPVADVNINPKNPVINTRSFGENPRDVAEKVLAYASGLEAGGVLSVCKHFPGHGDTEVDSHKALPLLPFTRARLDSVELYPFKRAVAAGLGGVMVGHLEVPALERRKGVPASLSRSIAHDLLAEEMGFKGLVFTDALAMKGVGSASTLCLQALLAGNDLLLVPRRLKEEVAAVMSAIRKGQLPESAINEKCRKVLSYKYALGLSKKPHIRLSGLEQRINTPEAEELITRLKQAAVTVVDNPDRMLPLDISSGKIAVLNVGDLANTRSFMKTLSENVVPAEFQLPKEQTPAVRKQLLDALKEYRQILVCVTDTKPEAYRSFFETFAPQASVAYLFFVQGKVAAQFPEEALKGKTVVLAHSSDEVVQRQVARLLCGDAVANGRLSCSLGKAFPAGAGVTLTPKTLPYHIPENYGIDANMLSHIDTIAREGIRIGAYPGCQIVVLRSGKVMYDKAFGTHTGGKKQTGDFPDRQVLPTDVYDLASLTKTTATLLAVMKLYDKGRINLTDKASRYLPFLQNTDKAQITLRELLLHESGLPSTIQFYVEAIDKESYPGTLFKGRSDKLHPVRIGSRTWANPKFGFKDSLISGKPTEEYALQVCDGLWTNKEIKRTYERLIAEAPLKDKQYRYSCVGFIVLQMVVEACTGMSLDAFLKKEFYEPMGLQRTAYLPLRTIDKREIVPSSHDRFLRKCLLRGFVHDESAAFQGGVSGNAGLFSTAEEVARVYQMLLNGGELDGKHYLSRETCRLFTTTVSKKSRRGLGFDKPDVGNPEKSPCAESAPASVYGHTGFTGTCAWVDPDNELVYVFLCNRTFPDVWNTKLMQHDIRTRIQEAVYDALIKKNR